MNRIVNGLKPKCDSCHLLDIDFNMTTFYSDTEAAVDSKAEAIRVEPKDYVPNASQMDRTTQRIYSFFNTNEKIVKSTYNEDEWISYYEAVVNRQINVNCKNMTVCEMYKEFTEKEESD
jgi:hypothetical protein